MIQSQAVRRCGDNWLHGGLLNLMRLEVPSAARGIGSSPGCAIGPSAVGPPVTDTVGRADGPSADMFPVVAGPSVEEVGV